MAKKNEQAPKHWADIYAEKVIREKGDKPLYTCASGITPSGTVHIGNFREIISVDLVVRALREMGKQVRFIYSWDDYDVFRKVPKNMPEPELLAKYLRYPIVLVPDTTGRADNYARGNEIDVERELPKVGIHPEYIYQAARYRASEYADGIRMALEKRDEIKAILDKYRTEPLPDTWLPISVFSSFTHKDTTTVLSWDGEWGITYRDDSTGQTETIDLRKTSLAKLPWRVDWPMRWKREQVDFEPAGKDHHSEGGSFDTSKEVVELFGGHAPVSFQYDFISIKGHGGKISSSSGDVVSLPDVLEIYTPEVTRYMYQAELRVLHQLRPGRPETLRGLRQLRAHHLRSAAGQGGAQGLRDPYLPALPGRQGPGNDQLPDSVPPSLQPAPDPRHGCRRRGQEPARREAGAA